MDSGVSMECKDSADEALKKSDEPTVVEAKGSFLDPSSVAVGSITPGSIRMNGEFPDSSSPITLLRKPVKSLCFDLETSIDDSSSPRTPKDLLFDPFSPVPDHLALAPLRNLGISNIGPDFGACRTSPSTPRLTGIADTRPGGKSRKLDLAFAESLNFDAHDTAVAANLDEY